MAARLALGLGLHSSSSYIGIPVDVAESRKRLFFSVYMMDRSVLNPSKIDLHDYVNVLTQQPC